MPRHYPRPPLTEVEPGVFVTRNTCIIDASKARPKESKEDSEDGPNPKEDREHAPHENGGPEGSPKGSGV